MAQFPFISHLPHPKAPVRWFFVWHIGNISVTYFSPKKMFRCLTNSWLGADLKQASLGKLLKYWVILNIWCPGGTHNGAYCLMIARSAGVFSNTGAQSIQIPAPEPCPCDILYNSHLCFLILDSQQSVLNPLCCDWGRGKERSSCLYFHESTPRMY